MVDIENEQLVTLQEIAKLSDRSYSTVLRWVNDGAKSLNGRRVKLETVKTPSGKKATTEAYYRFLRALNEC